MSKSAGMLHKTKLLTSLRPSVPLAALGASVVKKKKKKTSWGVNSGAGVSKQTGGCYGPELHNSLSSWDQNNVRRHELATLTSNGAKSTTDVMQGL